MKNLSAVFMLILCLSTMVCSCEKEGGNIDKKKLEGKWWYAEKKEFIFNGEVVETDIHSPGLYNNSYEKIYFDSGNLTGARLNGQIIETWGYSIMGDVLTHTFWDYRINKLTRNEFVLSQLVWDWTSPDKNDISKGIVITTYKGKDIYSYNGDKWYYDNNGNIVRCDNRNGYSGPWWDTIKYYYSSSR